MAHILIADDSPISAELLSSCLRGEGHEITVVDNGQKALDAAPCVAPSAILLDVMMPVKNGIETCRRLKADVNLQDIPVILITSLSDNNDIIRGLDAGADDYITKPFDVRVVACRVRNAVNRYQVLSENRVLTQEMERLATTDALTGLWNRRIFLEQFERELSLAVRHSHPLSAVLMDVDFFKKINDDYGHPVGDEALRAIAATLTSCSRTTDYMCRYGGEEFAVLLPHTDERGAAEWAERARTCISEIAVPLDGRKISFTASFGVASRQDDVSNADELLHCADEALLVAKRSGRDRVVSHSEFDETTSLAEAADCDDQDWRSLVAADIMTSRVTCLPQNGSLCRAADALLRLGINSFPVVDSGGRLTGIISEKDILVAYSRGEMADRRIGDHMSRNVVRFQETDSVETIHQFLCRNTIRRVVVVSEDRPVGVISRGDLLRWITHQSGVCTV